MTENVLEKETLTEEKLMESWTTSEKENSKEKYGVEIMIDNGTWEQVNTKECPNDASIITYVVDGQTRYDLTRGQKAVNIFNMYYDKFRGGMKSINYGKGTYNPKTWGIEPPKIKKRK